MSEAERVISSGHKKSIDSSGPVIICPDVRQNRR